ncbi:MAG: SurA N-terminal domain-containing protein [Candidatus Omnitrophota bacterium]|nr:SurA N-terminal domain-containing protein [Candidatus Omnitrophota bacterium]
MLNKFRTHHKKILWVLAVLIIPAFVMWGSLKDDKEEIIAKIGSHKITKTEFKQYADIAEIYFAFFTTADKTKKFTAQDIFIKGLEYLLLIQKADKERIKISDKEVADAVKKIKLFMPGGKFDSDIYYRFLNRLRIAPRTFEEYIRNILKADRLYAKHVRITVTDSDLKKIYKKDNQKAKITYIFIPYDKFKDEINVTAEEIESFYQKNKNTFEEESKIKIKYALVSQDTEVAAKILKDMPNIKTIDDLKNKFGVEIKETGFIGIKDPIEGMGWQPLINKYAFSLKKKSFNQPLDTNIGYIFIEKQEEKPAYIPTLAQIKDKIESRIKQAKEKEQAKVLCVKILEKIKNEEIKNIAKIAAQEKLDLKEAGYFKYYDYIEGLGLSEKVSKIIFSLKKDNIYPYPILLLKGAYIIQLKEITSFDEKDFTQKQENYRQYLIQQKTFIEKTRFVSRLAKEAKLTTAIKDSFPPR